MKENKNFKNQNYQNQSQNQSQNQTPSPAVPNRAHTEMKNEKTNKKDGAQSQNSKNSK